MNTINVLKRGKATESYQPDKIKNVTQAAGLKPDQAELIANRVTEWIQSLTQMTISSEEIRNKVLTEMQKIDVYSAGLFQWYEKNKER